MTDLHGRISAKLDQDQALAEAAVLTTGWFATNELRRAGLRLPDARYVTAQDPARTLRRIAAEREVLAIHTNRPAGAWCRHCIKGRACPDLRLLAARCDVAVDDD